ncbi:MAG: hypothetical protein AAB893_00815, partial [Patescibacteria group bacterium]
MKNVFIIVAGILLFVGITYGVFVLSDSQSSTTAIKRYKKNEKQKPKVIVVGNLLKSLKKMKVSDTKSAKFTIKNVGAAPLQLYESTTSCNCAFGQVLMDNYESDIFGMHAPQKTHISVAQGATAQIVVTYKPYIMPVYGKIQRYAIIRTNDPVKPELTFT